MKRIVYFQHAGALGGSAYSLLYTIESLDRSKYEPIVVLARPNRELATLYERAGIEVVAAEDVSTFEHSTAEWWRWNSGRGLSRLAAAAWRWRGAKRATRRIVERLNPDLVHLNSVVLVPSARALKDAGVPFIWHVREHPAEGHLGLRRKAIAGALRNWADEVIFISEFDRRGWMGDRHGQVVRNFVDLDRFRPRDGGADRGELGLAVSDRVVLFLGGNFQPIKGLIPLLDALAIVRRSIPSLICLVPGGEYDLSSSLDARLARKVLPLFGSGTPSQRVMKRIEQHQLGDVVRLLPWESRIERLLAAADVLVVPSVQAHFARPVIEAGAMARPAVGFDVGGVSELIVDGVTGSLVPVGSVDMLADAITDLLSDAEKRRAFGSAARDMVERESDARRQVGRIEAIYDQILSSRTRPYRCQSFLK